MRDMREPGGLTALRASGRSEWSRGIDPGMQRLPSGEPYVLIGDWQRAVKRARSAVRRTEAGAVRQDMLVTLQVLKDIYKSEKSVFLSRLGHADTTVAVIDTLEAADRA